MRVRQNFELCARCNTEEFKILNADVPRKTPTPVVKKQSERVDFRFGNIKITVRGSKEVKAIEEVDGGITLRLLQG